MHMCAFRRRSSSTARINDAPGRYEWIILAIGNPGPQYAESRHNVGWWAADMLRKRHRGKLTDAGVCHQAMLDFDGTNALLAYPKTYVNRSGTAANTLLERHGVDVTQLLVICDDINLPVGTIRVRTKGGAGGHNGLTSIIDAIGTNDFPRIRIGVGKQVEGTSQVDHVLGIPSASEAEDLRTAAHRAADATATAITEGLDAAMNGYNRSNPV